MNAEARPAGCIVWSLTAFWWSLTAFMVTDRVLEVTDLLVTWHRQSLVRHAHFMFTSGLLAKFQLALPVLFLALPESFWALPAFWIKDKQNKFQTKNNKRKTNTKN